MQFEPINARFFEVPLRAKLAETDEDYFENLNIAIYYLEKWCTDAESKPL